MHIKHIYNLLLRAQEAKYDTSILSRIEEGKKSFDACISEEDQIGALIATALMMKDVAKVTYFLVIRLNTHFNFQTGFNHTTLEKVLNSKYKLRAREGNPKSHDEEAAAAEAILILRYQVAPYSTINLENILLLAEQLPSGLYDKLSLEKLKREFAEFQAAVESNDPIDAVLEAADVLYYAVKLLDLMTTDLNRMDGFRQQVSFKSLELVIEEIYSLRETVCYTNRNEEDERHAVKKKLSELGYI